MVAIIILRTLNRDIALYNEEDLKEDPDDTTGWKLLHGDVFRPPKLGLSAFGVLNPAYRGGTVSYAIFIFMLMGVRLVMWFGISTPLIFVGGYFGFKKQAIEHPVRTNQIPRQIPEQVWYLRPIFSIAMAGLIPFAVIFLELFFILKSVWHADQYYYMFGFLGLVFLLLILTCVEITIVIIYFTLSAECWNWHWRAFFVSSSSTLYIVGYSVFYYVHKLEMDHWVAGMMYYVYCLLAGFVYW
ncbi:hypothetical protein HK102_010808 [Quaeritorhiza haematococci]|nr:hypothetical protein HK102_010808 [Quaeritorhiza haematococci]